jgi:hypothetical protein
MAIYSGREYLHAYNGRYAEKRNKQKLWGKLISYFPLIRQKSIEKVSSKNLSLAWERVYRTVAWQQCCYTVHTGTQTSGSHS